MIHTFINIYNNNLTLNRHNRHQIPTRHKQPSQMYIQTVTEPSQIYQQSDYQWIKPSQY